MRLDQALVEKNLVPSRERGRALIMAGKVQVNGQPATKAGQPVSPDDTIALCGDDLPYVSRGGLKLEKALKSFPANPRGKVCMDIGASTGGFTDCMLQNGARHVYAVDVGYGQFAWTLRNDPRVTLLERTNIRHLQRAQIKDKIAFFGADVSFISLKHIFPAMRLLGAEDCEGICLVKPQFEAGRGQVGKNGVVREPQIHVDVLKRVQALAVEQGFGIAGLDYSPIRGPKGNIEYLLYVKSEPQPAPLPPETIAKTVTDAHHQLLSEPL